MNMTNKILVLLFVLRGASAFSQLSRGPAFKRASVCTAATRQQHKKRPSRSTFQQQDEWLKFDDDDDDGVLPPSTTTTTPTTRSNSHFFSQKSLQDSSFGNSATFHRLCRGADISRPSKIQSLAWPVLMQGKHAIVADQTGSGKTLAYLIPLLERTLAQADKKKIKAPGTPRLLILSPTAELADQTRAVCDKLASSASAAIQSSSFDAESSTTSTKKPLFKTMVVTANGKYATSIRDQIRMLQRTDIDVLISTPGRLSTILRTRNAGLDLSQLMALVLDEVDVLLVDDTFGPQLRTVGAAAPVNQTQFVFCTATLPNHICQQVEREFPGVVQVRGPGLHRVAPTVHERLVDVSVPPRHNRDANYCFDVKGEHLLKALRETKCRRTLVFCNTIETCRKVENLLKRTDRRGQILEVIPYHNALTAETRNENMALFSKGRKQQRRSQHPEQQQQQQRRGRGKQDTSRNVDRTDYVLVCTDRAARGVDFEAAPVDHVVIFDFPKDPAEYVRRVGRTARAGRGGTSTVFAFGWQLPIARSVMSDAALDTSQMMIMNNNNKGDDDDGDDDFGGGYSSRKTKRQKKQTFNNKKNRVKGDIEEKRLWER